MNDIGNPLIALMIKHILFSSLMTGFGLKTFIETKSPRSTTLLTG